jgi:hypothetical protein
MSSPEGNQRDENRQWVTFTLVGLVGQVGCVTLVLVLLVIFLGLWLDSLFDTRPIITFVLVLASVPVSILLMLFLSRKGVDRIKARIAEEDSLKAQEDKLGRRDH